ncbi:MAG: hypothetical protein DRJ18_00940 [Candidatus Methanomethylicota archaeon]|nr:MAG: hypothetical protein DRJ18_00940 [Candidatus Verstraetearchaeota archaeon]
MKFELKTVEDRKKAFKELRSLVLNDIGNGRLPTFHILHIERDGTADNHYMTPISLEPVDEKGTKAVWVQDFEFFLKLLLKLKKVVEVEYDPKRPAIIFTYEEV